MLHVHVHTETYEIRVSALQRAFTKKSVSVTQNAVYAEENACFARVDEALHRWALSGVQSQHEQERHKLASSALCSSGDSRWRAGLHNVCEGEREM